MSERDSRRLLTELETDDAHSSDELQPLERFLEFFSEVGNQYISDTLCAALEPVLDQMDQLMGFLARNFFYYQKSKRAIRFVVHSYPASTSTGMVLGRRRPCSAISSTKSASCTRWSTNARGDATYRQSVKTVLCLVAVFGWS